MITKSAQTWLPPSLWRTVIGVYLLSFLPLFCRGVVKSAITVSWLVWLLCLLPQLPGLPNKRKSESRQGACTRTQVHVIKHTRIEWKSYFFGTFSQEPFAVLVHKAGSKEKMFSEFGLAKPGVLSSAPSNTFGMNWDADCEPGLFIQHRSSTLPVLFWVNGSKSPQPGSS